MLAAGVRVRQYEIIRELGRGGMGRVLLARDTRLGRRVAIKFLLTASRELIERFLTEARTTAQVGHENIVVIHEVDEHEGAPYMVLEHLEGSTLRQLLDGSRVPAARAVELIVPVVRALVRAHEAGIVHRDLKPENVIVTDAGTIKVLDFGIAKLLAEPTAAADEGALVGTLPYMSPEQLAGGDVDHQTDVWAVGIMLFELVTGAHPLPGRSATSLIAEVCASEEPMPRVGLGAPDLPERLERLIDRCLEKRRDLRYRSARDLLDDLEPQLPGRYGRQLAEDESPYPGLHAFQEGDADRFFGRGHDIARTVTRLREQPLVGIVGPSGIGKSSFLRAGVVPALKALGEAWDVHLLRPGRQPLSSLASLLFGLNTIATMSGDDAPEPGLDHATVVARLAAEPGYLGTLLRARAARKQTRILLFIDQFEELYTLVADPAERLAYTRCLAAIADDAAAPLRIVVSMRSDFLDRAGEDRRFLDELTRGLVFLQPLGPQALREALVQPLEMRGYQFEDTAMVDGMLAALASTPGALPLLQFTATKLWEARDRGARLLTRSSYDAIGGISGTLATHADQVLAGLAPAGQRLVHAVFLRLITPERTRALVDLGELRELAPDPSTVEQVVDHLVNARLLVVHSLGEAAGGSIEIVHESLIASWPTLRRWLDEGQDDATQLAQLRAAAAQWDSRGRAPGLLWRGDALVEARKWQGRYRGELPRRERAFLDAVFALGTRAARVKRAIVIAVIVLLSLAAAGSGIALLSIREAKQAAQAEAARAEREKLVAQERLEQLEAEQAAKQKAEDLASRKDKEVDLTRDQLREALSKAERDRAIAIEATQQAQQATAREHQRYLEEKARADAAERRVP